MLEHMFGLTTVIPAAVTPGVPDLAWTRYALLDRGSYEHAAMDVPAQVVALASEATGRALRVRSARVLRLSPGDYLLARHDTLHDDDPVEIVADLSPVAVPGAEVHYRRRGKVYFRFASQPGALAIVARGPTVTCNHTYVSKLHAGASVVRLVALLTH